MNPEFATPIAMTIAGSDSSGGAGVQADLKTFSALSVYGACVITAVTAQNTHQVRDVAMLPDGMVQHQIETVLEDLAVDAIKVGLLGTSSVIKEVATSLESFRGYIVLDPVMVAKSGDPLLAPEAIDSLREWLMPKVDLITPNLPEAAALLNVAPACHSEEALAQGKALCLLGTKAVLMKGGHGNESVCTDWLVQDQEEPMKLVSSRVSTPNTHGTGCTYSAAIAAHLARRMPLKAAVRQSHQYLAGAIRSADRLRIGSGHGPVHHFHQIWHA